MAIVTITIWEFSYNFAISKCEFYNFEKENIKYAHIQILVLFISLFFKYTLRKISSPMGRLEGSWIDETRTGRSSMAIG